ncbi:ribosomal RNA-processing protein 1 [Diutina catenulata]
MSSKFVKQLASNDTKSREKALSSLRKFLGAKQQSKLPLLELEKLWRGLYFSMWYCDKPGPQQQLAEDLGKLYSESVHADAVIRFYEAFWVIMMKEWASIDKWRIDKYLMLIRRVVRHVFIFLNKQKWDDKFVQEFIAVNKRTVLSGAPQVASALPYHVIDLFLDELERVVFETGKEAGDTGKALPADYISEDEDSDESDEEDSENEDDDESEDEKPQEAAPEEDDDELSLEEKRELMAEVPVIELISPFKALSEEPKVSMLRDKCRDEVVNDPRLKEWGVVEEETIDEDSDDEWKGFA